MEIYLPKTLKTVGQSAFSGCKALKTVNYASSSGKWNKIVFEKGNDPIFASTLNYSAKP